MPCAATAHRRRAGTRLPHPRPSLWPRRDSLSGRSDPITTPGHLTTSPWRRISPPSRSTRERSSCTTSPAGPKRRAYLRARTPIALLRPAEVRPPLTGYPAKQRGLAAGHPAPSVGSVEDPQPPAAEGGDAQSGKQVQLVVAAWHYVQAEPDSVIHDGESDRQDDQDPARDLVAGRAEPDDGDTRRVAGGLGRKVGPREIAGGLPLLRWPASLLRLASAGLRTHGSIVYDYL